MAAAMLATVCMSAGYSGSINAEKQGCAAGGSGGEGSADDSKKITVTVLSCDPHITVSASNTFQAEKTEKYWDRYVDVLWGTIAGRANTIASLKPEVAVTHYIEWYQDREKQHILNRFDNSFSKDAVVYAFSKVRPPNIWNIEDTELRGCKLPFDQLTGEITVPDYVTKIGYKAFEKNPFITKVVFSEHSRCTTIGREAFKLCTGLQAVCWPSGIKKIDYDAFEGCTSLTNIKLPIGIENMDRDAFKGCTGLTELDLFSCVQLEEVTGFKGCTGLTKIKLPLNVKKIDVHAFKGCTGLTELDLSPYTQLEALQGFAECTGLKSFKLALNVKKIDEDAFAGCTGLMGELDLSMYARLEKVHGFGRTNITGFKLPLTVTNIGNAFTGCTGLTGTLDLSMYTRLEGKPDVLPEEILSMLGHVNGLDKWAGKLKGAFSYCTGITSVKLPLYIENIDEYAFKDCTGLTSINLPASVESISYSAFEGCTALTEITVPANVKSIYTAAFKNCINLALVAIESAHLHMVGEGAFKDIKSDARFIVKTEAVKQLIFKSLSGIPQERIEVRP